MNPLATPIQVDAISSSILLIRGERVIVDVDLAGFYGVRTKALNQQVRRNRDRFPQDFVFQLTAAERSELVTDCDRFVRLKHSKEPPFVFTEHGAMMVASVLNSQRAADVSVFIVRAFVQMRRVLTGSRELAQRLAELERRLSGHDERITEIITAIRSLLGEKPTPPRRPIGFRLRDETVDASDTVRAPRDSSRISRGAPGSVWAPDVPKARILSTTPTHEV
jgi:hypothetical protein